MYSEKTNKLWISLVRMPVLLIFVFVVISLIPGCGKNDMSTNSVSKTSANDISISGMAFLPSNKTISVGTTIKWTNNDAVTHTVTSGVPGNSTGMFDSGDLAPNGTFTYTFNQAGTYNYYCKIHNSMRGTITVQSGGGGGYGNGGY